VQAAQMARPVVATQVGGLPEVVLQGRTGLLTPPNDSHGLAEHIRYLLDHPAQAQAMGRAARERASQCFSLSRMADDYERLYARILMENVV
jgi:glycogen(starch) synthase